MNAYGATLDRMWPHLAPDARDRLVADLLAMPEGGSLGDYVLIARAQIAPNPLSIADLSAVLEQSDKSGELPHLSGRIRSGFNQLFQCPTASVRRRGE